MKFVCLAGVLTLSCLSIYLYILSFHRITTVSSMVLAAKVAMLPVADKRCKILKNDSFRCLPNIFFIGASKCGTTSISRHLLSYPDIYFVNRRIEKMDNFKEIHRFDRNTYPLALPAIELMDEWASSPIISNMSSPVIHYTPHYLFAPTVPFDLRSFHPTANKLKFIVSLREPVSRVLSSYWFKSSRVANGIKSGPQTLRDSGSIAGLEKSIMNEINWRSNLIECMRQEMSSEKLHAFLTRQNVSTSPLIYDDAVVEEHRESLNKCFGSWLRSSNLGKLHLSKSVYVEQLTRWFINFPSSNFLIITLEQFQSDPSATFRCILSFIGVESAAASTLSWCGSETLPWRCCREKASNKGQEEGASSSDRHMNLTVKWLESPNSNRRDSPLPAVLNKTLHSYFYSYNTKLNELLGQTIF